MFELTGITLRPPLLEDGMAVFDLIKSCPPLDTNSSYCNLLQSSHFGLTSVAAEKNDTLVGFISGYIIPMRPDTLFIWQVAVSEQARGIGLASHMLAHILNRTHCNEVRYLETTITQDNTASWALFKKLASTLETELTSSEWMDKQAHFAGQHDSEILVRIGPIESKH